MLKDLLYQFIVWRHLFLSRGMPFSLRRKLVAMRSKQFEQGLRGAEKPSSQLTVWTAMVQCITRPIKSWFEQRIAAAKSKIEFLEAKVNIPIEDLAKDWVAKLMKARNKAILALEKKYKRIVQRVAVLQEKYFQALVRQRCALDTLGGRIPTKPSFLDSRKAMILTFIGVATLEAFLSFSAMDALGIPWAAMSIVVSFGLSTVIGLCCHLFGQALSEGRKVRAIIYTVLSACIVGFIIGLRTQADDPNGDIPQLWLAMGNFLALAIGLALGERVNRFRYYFQSSALIKDIPAEIDDLTQTLTLEATERAQIDQNFTTKAHILATNERKTDLLKLAQRNASLAKTQAGLNAFEDIEKNWIDEGHAALESSALDGFNLSKTLRFSLFPLLFAACLMAGGCSTSNTEALVIPFDISQSPGEDCRPAPEVVVGNILNAIGYSHDDMHFNKGVAVHLTTIGTDDLPKVTTISLEPAPSALFDNLKARRGVVDAFIGRLKDGVETIYALPHLDRHTNIQGSLCYLFDFMRENEFSKHHQMLWPTDGHQDADGIDFKDHPDSLVLDVIKRLDDICDLGDLSTFEITIISCSDRDSPEHVYRNVKFWEERFQKAGAKVRVISNLQNLEV